MNEACGRGCSVTCRALAALIRACIIYTWYCLALPCVEHSGCERSALTACGPGQEYITPSVSDKLLTNLSEDIEVSITRVTLQPFPPPFRLAHFPEHLGPSC